MAETFNIERNRHVLGKIRSVVNAIAQADDMALQAIRMLIMLPKYGVFNETGMSETRKAICAWLNIPITDEQAEDARGWEAFIRPHIEKLRD